MAEERKIERNRKITSTAPVDIHAQLHTPVHSLPHPSIPVHTHPHPCTLAHTPTYPLMPADALNFINHMKLHVNK